MKPNNRQTTMAEAADQLRRAEAEITRLHRLLAEEQHAAQMLLAGNNALLAERDDLRRQLAEADAISKAQTGVALRTDGVPFIHVADVRRSYARLHQVLNASVNDALIMDHAADEIESLRRQLAECQAQLQWHKTNGVSGVKHGRQDEQYYRP